MDGSNDLRMRQRILALVREFPGLHLREVARQLDTSVALVEYHAPVLQEKNLVHVEPDGRYLRLYPEKEGHRLEPAKRRHLAVLRQEIPLQVCLRLLDAGGPLRHGELVDRLGIGKSKLSFHLGKLMATGLVHKDADGAFDLVDRESTTDLLLSHRPTPDLRDRFHELWVSFYSR